MKLLESGLALAVGVLTACGGATAEGTTTPPPIAHEATDEAPPAPAGPTTPKALLVALRARVDADDLAGVRALVLDYTDPGGESVPDQVVEGIARGDTHGDWAFSRAALEVAIDRAAEFTVPDAELTERIAGLFSRLDPRLSDPTRMRIFDSGRGGTHIVVVEVGGEYRLVFWESLTSLVAPRPSATSAD